MSHDIVQHDNDVLRRNAEVVDADEFNSEKLQQVIESMKEALHATPDGVAIAAPQIGVSKRIFVVSGRVYDSLQSDNNDQKASSLDRVFINPEIIKHARNTELMHEGCLSVRNYYGYVPRHPKVTVRALNESGIVFTEGRSGLLAQIFQHETDHLDGVLFIDKAQNVEYREHETTNIDDQN